MVQVQGKFGSPKDGTVYKTKNVYALDDRDVYFISDPPIWSKLLATVYPIPIMPVAADQCGYYP